MFEFPYVDDAKYYTLFITYDSIIQPQKKDFIVQKKEAFPISLIKDLKLGEKYKWYVETTLKSGKKTSSEYQYFSILNTTMNNPKFYKKIQYYNKESKINDGIIWCDQYRCAVDRKGNIVWFFSEEQNSKVHAKVIRDIKLYPDGSMTFVNQPNAGHYDIDLNPIWEAPFEGTVAEAKKEDYHHDFEVLSNGNYMILGNEKVSFANESPTDTIMSEEVDFCNIIEFDKSGKIVWTWRMKDYFPYEFLINSKIETRTGVVNPHANSFCVDEIKNEIYLSYRDISRIIKIDKKTKKIVSSYGFKLSDQDSVVETNLFRLQHDIQLLKNNDILMFNNDDIDKGKISCIQIIHFPESPKDSLYLKWKFALNYDKDSDGKVQRMGGVKIMPNGNYLICEGSSNRVVEISPKGELLWDFALRQRDSTGRVNDKFALYRADFSFSLYPNYFTFFVNNKKNELLLINKGFESDKYFINVYDKLNKLMFSKQTTELKTNKSIRLQLPFDYHEDFKIEVTSVNTKRMKLKN